VKQQSGSLDTVGICARTVADVVLLRAVLADVPYMPVPAEEGSLRIAICRPSPWEKAEAAASGLVEAVAATLARSGVEITALALPDDLFDDWESTQTCIANFESTRNFAFEKTRHKEKLSSDLYDGRIMDGERWSLDDYIRAQRRAEKMRFWYDSAMEGIDAVITLPAPGEAPLGLRSTGSAVFNALWTMLYPPCFTLPAGAGPAGMPLGVQLAGRRFEDERLFAVAARVEAILRRD
jgi:amidase